MRRVALKYAERPGWVALRELRGHDEESVCGVDTFAAIALVDALLCAVPGAAMQPGEAARLSAADRDRILTDVCVHELGARIESTLPCRACGEVFDLDFRLDELVARVDEQAARVERAEDGRLRTPEGWLVRLPTGTDELEALAHEDPEAELTRRCPIEGAPTGVELDQVMEAVAPLVDVELDAQCPACGAACPVHFDAQAYLLGLLVADADRRASEIHRLAWSYRWPLADILQLPRARRQAFVELAERDAAAGLRR